MSLPVSVRSRRPALPGAGGAWALAAACFESESRRPPPVGPARPPGGPRRPPLFGRACRWGCRTGRPLRLVSLSVWRRSPLLVQSGMSESCVLVAYFSDGNPSMETGYTWWQPLKTRGLTWSWDERAAPPTPTRSLLSLRASPFPDTFVFLVQQSKRMARGPDG